MRVSLVNVNLVAPDAIGQCLLNQARFFLRQGDDVRIYVMHPPVGVDESIAARTEVVTLRKLLAQSSHHFHTSDLYVYHYPSRYDLVDTLPGLDRGAVIFYYHNVTPPELWAEEADRQHLADSRASVRLFAHYSDLIVTDSQFNADELVQAHACDPERVLVLPLAVSLEQFAPGPKNPEVLDKHQLQGKPVILFVGRMASNKRIDLLVEALAYVKERVPQAVLLLVGDERGNMAIQKIVEEAGATALKLGIAESVVFTGRVEALPDYYSVADVYASASVHEGFGVPLLEAMASGKPVVASDVPAHAWVLDGAGLLTRLGDPRDIAEKIVQVLTDDGLYGELANRGRLRAHDFSLAQYEVKWAEAVLHAIQWLPPHPPMLHAPDSGYDRQSEGGDALGTGRAPGLPDVLRRELVNSADIIDHEYRMRSGVPIVGPLIVWIRQNLTSHVAAYLHPILQKQIRYNQLVGDALLWLGSSLPGSSRMVSGEPDLAAGEEIAALNQRLATVEARLRAVEVQLAQVGDSPVVDGGSE